MRNVGRSNWGVEVNVEASAEAKGEVIIIKILVPSFQL
jgi:hypothetical protein